VRLSTRVALAILILLVAEALGLAVLPVYLKIIQGWLTIWPAPAKHFADLVGHVAWPLSVLLIVWLLRRPITRAAYILAERMKSDNLKLGGFFEVTKADFNTLDRQLVADHVAPPLVIEDVNTIEALLEYAGLSEENAVRFLNWIAARHGASLDPEEFLTSPAFANDRHAAYIELVGNG